MGFQWPPDDLYGAARAGSDGLGSADSGSMTKCRSVLHFRTGLVAVVIWVRAHFGVARWSTTSGRMDSGRASVEALRSCHRRTSLAWTVSGMHGSEAVRGVAVRRPGWWR